VQEQNFIGRSSRVGKKVAQERGLEFFMEIVRKGDQREEANSTTVAKGLLGTDKAHVYRSTEKAKLST
jgi:hypothetical protein